MVQTTKQRRSPKVDKIIRELRASLPTIRKSYGINRLSIFGSYVRKEEREKSDLDLLVEFDRAPTLFEFVRLKRHLTEILGIPVDLVMKKALKPAIGRHILEEAIPI